MHFAVVQAVLARLGQEQPIRLWSALFAGLVGQGCLQHWTLDAPGEVDEVPLFCSKSVEAYLKRIKAYCCIAKAYLKRIEAYEAFLKRIEAYLPPTGKRF